MLMGNKRLQAHSGERLRVLASRWWQASRAGAGDLWSGIRPHCEVLPWQQPHSLTMKGVAAACFWYRCQGKGP